MGVYCCIVLSHALNMRLPAQKTLLKNGTQFGAGQNRLKFCLTYQSNFLQLKMIIQCLEDNMC